MRWHGQCQRRELTRKQNRTTFPKGPFGGSGPVAGLGNNIVRENKHNSGRGSGFWKAKDFRLPGALKRRLCVFSRSHVSSQGPGTTFRNKSLPVSPTPLHLARPALRPSSSLPPAASSPADEIQGGRLVGDASLNHPTTPLHSQQAIIWTAKAAKRPRIEAPEY